MKVCIAEKPSVAKEIAFVLGAKSRKDGYFEGNGYAVTWTFGHFCSLLSPQDYNDQWKKWDLGYLPMLPEKFKTKLVNDKGIKKQFKIIRSLFKTASLVINCGDAGQEGELIQRWVINEAKYKGKVERLWISSLTKEAIQKGFQALKPAKDFENLYYAGSARAIGDWLLGMNATRLYTLKYSFGRQVLSIGRVQTPTLAMLVARHLEIIHFVPAKYWELHTLYRDTIFKHIKGKFDKKEAGQSILDKITSKPLRITDIIQKAGKEYAPKLFDLTSLQVECNKKFGLSANQTLKIIQKLYEKKVVTYPRVDTRYLPSDLYPKIKTILGKLSEYKQYTAQLLTKKITKSKRVFDDKKITDHHAIIPTGVQSTLDHNQQKVYDTVARRFIANFYPPCDFNTTTINAIVEKEKFKATGKQILKPGWKVLYPSNKKSDNKKEQELPSFQKGETGPHKPSLVEKETQPPKYYTEATLLRAMETAGKIVDNEELRDLMKENGIGRPSTRASIIETLYRRNYAYTEKKYIMATDLGIQLIATIQNELLKSPELTGQWEKKLRMIEQGKFSPATFIQEMKDMTNGIVKEVRSSKATSKIKMTHIPKAKQGSSTGRKTSAARRKVDKEISKVKKRKKTLTEYTCPSCHSGTIIKGKKAYGCSAYKSGCAFVLPFSFNEKKISENQYVRLLEKGSTVKLKGFIVNGQKVTGALSLSTAKTLILMTDRNNAPAKNTTPQCPRCKKGNIIKGKTAYGCSRWKSGCQFTYPFDKMKREIKGKKITKDLVIQMIQKQK